MLLVINELDVGNELEDMEGAMLVAPIPPLKLDVKPENGGGVLMALPPSSLKVVETPEDVIKELGVVVVLSIETLPSSEVEVEEVVVTGSRVQPPCMSGTEMSAGHWQSSKQLLLAALRLIDSVAAFRSEATPTPIR